MQRRVLVAGTFDGIHPGHESFLSQAKALGTELVVIIARDQTVIVKKGHAPVQSEIDRVLAVKELAMVDKAVLGSLGGDYLLRVVELNPDVLALGYDQWPNESLLRTDLDAHGLQHVEIVRLKPFEPDKYHSSLLKQ